MTNKHTERKFETVLVQSEKHINLRVVCDLIVAKINRGEWNKYDKSKVR